MNHNINLTRLKTVADALSEFREQIVFVGGATVSLYAAKAELTTIRATDDVDVVIELVTTGDFYALQERLLSLGFDFDREAKIISRYLYRGLKVDVMPTDPSIIGFTNPWYKEGVRKRVRRRLDDFCEIYIFSAPFFIASKMEAFLSRGKKDLFASHDLEDIIYIFDNRPEIREEILFAPATVKKFLLEQLKSLSSNAHFEEALLGHVERQNSQERVKRILSLIQDLQ